MPDHTRPDHTFPLIEVEGSGYEMGYQHGAQAAVLVQRYLRWIERLTGWSRDALCRNAMGFWPLMERMSPAFSEEVRGLAAGADISLEEAVLCQARAEAAQQAVGACTAFALTRSATADGTTLAGQNQDLEPEYADVALLLRVRPGDGRPRALMFTFAGQLGYSGMNEHGVAHFANALYGCTWRLGLPHYPIKRLVLEQRSVEDCVALLSRHRTCSAANLVLCDGQRTHRYGGNTARGDCPVPGRPSGRLPAYQPLPCPGVRRSRNRLPARFLSPPGPHPASCPGPVGDDHRRYGQRNPGRSRKRSRRDLPARRGRHAFDFRIHRRTSTTAASRAARPWLPGYVESVRSVRNPQSQRRVASFRGGPVRSIL